MSTRFQDSTFTFPHGTIFAIGQFKYPYFRKGLRFFNQTYRGSIYSNTLKVKLNRTLDTFSGFKVFFFKSTSDKSQKAKYRVRSPRTTGVLY